MGAFNSKQRNDMVEGNEMGEEDVMNRKKKRSLKDKMRNRFPKSESQSASNVTEKTSIVVPGECSAPLVQPKLSILSTDPRSPSAVDRTPLALESVPRHLLCPSDDPRSPSVAAVCRTPLRSAPPPSLTLPQAELLGTPIGERSPLLIETEDPRSPSCLEAPRTPIVMDSPAANFLKTNPHTTTLATPATIELDTKVVDRGQPKQVLQLRFKETLEALQKQEELDTPLSTIDTPLTSLDTPLACMDTPAAAGDLCHTPRGLDIPVLDTMDSPGDMLGII